jgi:hypothetical protein
MPTYFMLTEDETDQLRVNSGTLVCVFILHV